MKYIEKIEFNRDPYFKDFVSNNVQHRNISVKKHLVTFVKKMQSFVIKNILVRFICRLSNIFGHFTCFVLRASSHGYSAKRCAEHVLDMTISHSEIVVIVMSNESVSIQHSAGNIGNTKVYDYPLPRIMKNINKLCQKQFHGIYITPKVLKNNTIKKN